MERRRSKGYFLEQLRGEGRREGGKEGREGEREEGLENG